MTARRQRGVALLVALLVVALATILIAALVDGGQLSFARTRNQLRAAQAEAHARGLEAYAAQVLVRDMASGATDSNDDVWAMPLPPTPVPGGQIQAGMQDLNGCFNLNNLYYNGAPRPLWIERFRRLLRNLDLPAAIADASVDWIDPDNLPGDRGAEDAAYLSRTPPYLPANRPFADASELRLVAGVDARAWRELAPWVCALPTPTRLNLNTASVPVLMSLSEQMTRQLAERIHEQGHAHWPSVDAVLQDLGPVGLDICAPSQPERCGLAVSSEYFRARGIIELDGIEFVAVSLLQRHAGVRVVRRRPGGL